MNKRRKLHKGNKSKDNMCFIKACSKSILNINYFKEKIKEQKEWKTSETKVRFITQVSLNHKNNWSPHE